jgi:hypothetical protein
MRGDAVVAFSVCWAYLRPQSGCEDPDRLSSQGPETFRKHRENISSPVAGINRFNDLHRREIPVMEPGD